LLEFGDGRSIYINVYGWGNVHEIYLYISMEEVMFKKLLLHCVHGCSNVLAFIYIIMSIVRPLSRKSVLFNVYGWASIQENFFYVIVYGWTNVDYIYFYINVYGWANIQNTFRLVKKSSKCILILYFS